MIATQNDIDNNSDSLLYLHHRFMQSFITLLPVMIVEPAYPLAPELETSVWLNSDSPITLAQLRGKVVVIEVFQMLCPGCVAHGLPQATSISNVFSSDQVTVLGLHSVFEHHDVMQPNALEVFLHEYKISFPVGVDMPAAQGSGPIPNTMRTYALRGTPTLLVIDKAGRLRSKHFGRISDMEIAAEISALIYESGPIEGRTKAPQPGDSATGCDEDGCRI